MQGHVADAFLRTQVLREVWLDFWPLFYVEFRPAGAGVLPPYLDVCEIVILPAHFFALSGGPASMSRLIQIFIRCRPSQRDRWAHLRHSSFEPSSNAEFPAVNIHSHLGGALLFVVLLSTFRQVYFIHYTSITWMDIAVFVIFLSSAVFCLLCSAVFHTFSVHSEEVCSEHNWKLDVSHISFRSHISVILLIMLASWVSKFGCFQIRILHNACQFSLWDLSLRAYTMDSTASRYFKWFICHLYLLLV